MLDMLKVVLGMHETPYYVPKRKALKAYNLKPKFESDYIDQHNNEYHVYNKRGFVNWQYNGLNFRYCHIKLKSGKYKPLVDCTKLDFGVTD